MILIYLLCLTGQVLSEQTGMKNIAYLSKVHKLTNYYVYIADVYLSLGGVRIANNSHVDIDNIGTTDNDTNALLCHTGSADGDWYYHNNTITEDISAVNNTNIIFSDRLNQTVIKLFRNNTSVIEGQFYCLVNGTEQIVAVYVNICKS